MTDRIEVGGLQVDRDLHELVEQEVVPGLGIEADHVWTALAAIVRELGPENRALLDRRAELQAQLDEFCRAHRGQRPDPAEVRAHLEDIGYLQREGADFTIATSGVDEEIASIPGPQLVVPVNNARFALNAANARWGSLYDALYGSDLIDDSGGAEAGTQYNPVRGKKVMALAAAVLDEIAPLAEGSHADASGYSLVAEDGRRELVVATAGGETRLAEPGCFVGYEGADEALASVLLRHHGLHAELVIDREDEVGREHAAGVKDIVLEAAVTTIQDCEDSVAAVDGEDKTLVYRNWLGLMKGDLEETVPTADGEFVRRLAPDRTWQAAAGGSLTLPGRSLMLVRNVGHLMTTPAVLDADGNEIPEGMLDAMLTSLIGMHDLKRTGSVINSRTGESIYIVKPKMHGPREVAFTVDLFGRVEDALGLPRNTLKVGIMDEERRTTVNLKECIRQARERLIFINTGFLDRTGDEIHSSMELGPMVRKEDMKSEPWIEAYEDWNVDIGLECGLRGRAQIGKGMYPKPERMAEMMETKQAHPEAGANCAWVPSPTAATLHAIHYHRVDVHTVQDRLTGRERARLDDLLTIPVVERPEWSEETIREELENNAQGILGYLVRWIDQGIGCSKVPDIDDVQLMEDRATCRISSQHIANWLHHGICSEEQVRDTLQRMAAVVDRQNADDENYRPMADDPEHNIAFRAACDLVFKGREQPSGYTEPVLHARRLELKAQRGSG
ncbi:MAG: malate synthase G [Halofilum sp. (in: g-proteobacteria)]|nr:malate synthase G [Halofilum sp. (in: g-proteobacteria)]